MCRIRITYITGMVVSLFALLLVIVTYISVSNMDYNIAIKEERLYCEGVEANEHPDYKGIYGEVCK